MTAFPPFRPACRCAVLLCALTAPLRAQGPTIDTIIVITHDVFDSAEASRNAVFALANAVRFKTRPVVVRRELQFRAGQPYDSARVAESVRNLRRMGLFRAVSIDTVRMGDRLAAVVETRDGWTTQLFLTANPTSGESPWAVGLEERDVLGLAAAVGARYRNDPDDRTAWTFFSEWNRVLATRLLLSGAYDYRSDGRLGVWAAGFPFRAFGDRSALEIGGEAGHYRVLQWRWRDTLAVADTVQRRTLRLRTGGAAALSTAGDGYWRVGLVAQVKREAYVAWTDTLLPVPDSVSGALGLQLDWRRARFRVVTHYTGFAREEDVDLSTRVRLAAWAAPAAFGYARGGLGPELEAQTGVAFGRTFLRWEVQANGLFTADGLDSARVWSGLTVASRLASRHATVLHVEAGIRRGLPPGTEFDLGRNVGPRGFDVHAFTGTRSVWGTLEHRWFAVDEVLRVLGVGLAAFVDYGGAWYPGQTPRFGGDVGLGLRLGVTRATGANVGRFDVSYRWGDGHRSQFWFNVGRSYAF